MKTLKLRTVMPAVHFLQCRSCAWCHGLLVLPHQALGLVFSFLKLELQVALQFPWPEQRLQLPLQPL